LIEYIVVVFMLLAGVSFVQHYRTRSSIKSRRFCESAR
jgi:Trk-type K+ transport system membrane component